MIGGLARELHARDLLRYIFGPSSLNYIMYHRTFNALDHEMKTSKTRWVKMVGISCIVTLRARHVAPCSLWTGPLPCTPVGMGVQ